MEMYDRKKGGLPCEVGCTDTGLGYYDHSIECEFQHFLDSRGLDLLPDKTINYMFLAYKGGKEA